MQWHSMNNILNRQFYLIFGCPGTKKLWSNKQLSLFLNKNTFVTWLKLTLLQKIKCLDTTIYMKTQYLQTNGTQHYLGKENAGVAGELRDRVCAS